MFQLSWVMLISSNRGVASNFFMMFQSRVLGQFCSMKRVLLSFDSLNSGWGRPLSHLVVIKRLDLAWDLLW